MKKELCKLGKECYESTFLSKYSLYRLKDKSGISLQEKLNIMNLSYLFLNNKLI